MMAELMALKAQLAEKEGAVTPPAAPTSEEKAAETVTEETSSEAKTDEN
jgi:hypothetical protein